MHRHAIDGGVDRRQERRWRAEGVAPDHVQHPGAVFAAAPRDENLHFANTSGCSARAMTSVPSATRGPGTTVRGSLTIVTRSLRTAGIADSTFHAASSRAFSASVVAEDR